MRGGTAPQDVAALGRALSARLRARGLVAHDPDPSVAPGPDGLPLLVPVAPDEDPDAVVADLRRRLGEVPESADLILRTSGSTTGTGRLVAMSARALVASARATHARLDGPGRWVLALPSHHVAGLQVLVRAAVAGTAVVVVDCRRGFSPQALAEAVRAAGESGALPVYTSLVPAQLHAVLAAGQERWAAELGRAARVLVGGAAADPDLLASARQVGLRVVTTYGMSETGGGCVYDGVPLDGVTVRIEDPGPDGVGRIVLAGPVLAEGYAESTEPAESPGSREPVGPRGPVRPAGAGGTGAGGVGAGGPGAGGAGAPVTGFRRPSTPDLRSRGTSGGHGPGPDGSSTRPTGVSGVPGVPDGAGARGTELVTADRGRVGPDGLLVVLGRVDDLIVTGGVKVDPREVEEVLVSLPGVGQACVVGVPDPRWGSAVVAAVVPQTQAVLDPGTLRAAARERLGGVRAPKRLEVLEELPVRGPGKVDRRAVAARLLRAAPGEVPGSR